jgi:hypothetical protein
MSLWDEANEIESISNQISCLGNVLELVAEKLSSDPESGTLWLCRDVCENVYDKLQLRVEALLKIYTKKKNEQFSK